MTAIVDPHAFRHNGHVAEMCPMCDGTGAGDGYGVSGAGGCCYGCIGEGYVTPTKAVRLRAKNGSPQEDGT